MRKITLIFLLSIFFSVAANAGADGDNALVSKNQPEAVNDCFEKVNRGQCFNQFVKFNYCSKQFATGRYKNSWY